MKPLQPRRERANKGIISDTHARELVSGYGDLGDGRSGKLSWVTEWWQEHAPDLVDEKIFYPPAATENEADDWARRAVVGRGRIRAARAHFLIEGGFVSGAARERLEYDLQARARQRR